MSLAILFPIAFATHTSEIKRMYAIPYTWYMNLQYGHIFNMIEHFLLSIMHIYLFCTNTRYWFIHLKVQVFEPVN